VKVRTWLAALVDCGWARHWLFVSHCGMSRHPCAGVKQEGALGGHLAWLYRMGLEMEWSSQGLEMEWSSQFWNTHTHDARLGL
jgi:hypothetical protein